jgi:hypothetical protein
VEVVPQNPLAPVLLAAGVLRVYFLLAPVLLLVMDVRSQVLEGELYS